MRVFESRSKHPSGLQTSEYRGTIGHPIRVNSGKLSCMVRRLLLHGCLSPFAIVLTLAMTLFVNGRMFYGLLTSKLFPIFVTFITGECLAIFFMLIYFSVTLDKKYVVKVVACVCSFLFAITMYAILGKAGVIQQTSHQVERTMGSVGVAVSIVLYASPFETNRQVIETKSAALIPIVMCVIGIVGNFLWVAYGTLDSDNFLIVVNAVCVAIGVVQIALYLIYMPKCAASNDQGSWLADDDWHLKLDTRHTESKSSADFLTSRECINVAMESPEDQLQIVISPRSSA